MKILVIPDVHLKPQMFKQATALMHQGIADRAVCLMDIPDDWDKQYNVGLYEETYDEAIRFAKAFPETAWCYGNHDLSYLWHCLESGYSSMASMTVQRKLLDLREAVPEDNPIKYVQRIDNVLFSHGGVLNFFVEEYVPRAKYNDVDAVLETINQLGRIEMWNDASPIWLRPQHSKMRLYKPRKLLQVVGHTPMDAITKEGNLISTDVFSTYRDGKPIGTEEFLLLDTVTWEYCGISNASQADCHRSKPHPVYQALQLDKRGAIHIYGGLQKRSGQTDFVYSFELVARKRCVFDCFYIIEDLRRL